MFAPILVQEEKKAIFECMKLAERQSLKPKVELSLMLWY